MVLKCSLKIKQIYQNEELNHRINMLVIGLGGAFVNITASTTLQGMSLAAIVGITLNQVLSLLEK